MIRRNDGPGEHYIAGVALPPLPRRSAPNTRPCRNTPAGVSHDFGIARTLFQGDRSIAPGPINTRAMDSTKGNGKGEETKEEEEEEERGGREGDKRNKNSEVESPGDQHR